MKPFLLLLLLFSGPIFSQKNIYKITYDYHIAAKRNGQIFMNTYLKTYLTGDGKKSLYVEDFIDSQNKTDNQNAMNIKTENNPVFYKELLDNKVTYEDMVTFKFFNILDRIDNYDWQIFPETKTILNYTCQKASLFFRGSIIEVYFTKDIPFSDGPWKLSGLPGMILEYRINNDAAIYNAIASKVEINTSSTEIINPYQEKQTITYKEFVTIYRKKYDDNNAKISSEGGSGGMPKGYKELYIIE